MLIRHLCFLMLILVSCSTSKKTAHHTLTDAEAVQGIRESLNRGADQAISVLAHDNGFSGSYKLTLPDQAQVIETSLRTLGMGALADKAIIQINRAAEDAAGTARPILKTAIAQTNFNDPLSLIHGQDDAITKYFIQKNRDALTTSMIPVVKSSLDKMNATKYYGDMLTTYNGFPSTSTKLNPDLSAYVVEKMLYAIIDQMSKEEALIRHKKSQRNSAALRMAF